MKRLRGNRSILRMLEHAACTAILLLLLVTVNLLPAESKPGRYIHDVSCYDDDAMPYIESIPHPTDCHLFYKCDRYSPEHPYNPIAFGQTCSDNLYFDMETCNCQYLADATCFDPSNATHAANRMKCACPLIKDPDSAGYRFSDRCAGIGEDYGR